jgi:hypothetical protein
MATMATPAEVYRSNVERCEAKAREADPALCARFLELANRWRKMAADHELRQLTQIISDRQHVLNDGYEQPVARGAAA